MKSNPAILLSNLINVTRFAQQHLGFSPEPHQLPVLESTASRGILCCSRQWGKSTIISVKSLHRALFSPGSLIVICAPTMRQSNELLAKIKNLAARVSTSRLRTDGHNRVSLVLDNGSRIVAIPADPDTTRGFSSVGMLLIDEASRVPDSVFHALTPMLARSAGDIWLLSTPHGRQGFFHQLWHSPDPAWFRFFNTVDDCPNIPRDFLDRERSQKPEADFLEDYYCVFQDTASQLYASDDVRAAFSSGVGPLFASSAMRSGSTRLHYYLGLDLGQRRDYTAIAIVEYHAFNTGEFDLLRAAWKTASTRHLRYLRRLPLQTSYQEVVENLSNLVSRAPLSGNTTIVMDATGPGLPVLDFIRKARLGPRIVPVSITGAGSPGHNNGLETVPKRALVSHLQLLLQSRKLAISKSLDLAPALEHELVSARPESHHGDLATALALAAWRIRLETQ